MSSGGSATCPNPSSTVRLSEATVARLPLSGGARPVGRAAPGARGRACRPSSTTSAGSASRCRRYGAGAVVPAGDVDAHDRGRPRAARRSGRTRSRARRARRPRAASSRGTRRRRSTSPSTGSSRDVPAGAVRGGDRDAARRSSCAITTTCSRMSTCACVPTTRRRATRPRSCTATTSTRSRPAPSCLPTFATTTRGRSSEPERYLAEFNRAVARQLPEFALEIENR